jgi:hypothetical protein
VQPVQLGPLRLGRGTLTGTALAFLYWANDCSVRLSLLGHRGDHTAGLDHERHGHVLVLRSDSLSVILILNVLLYLRCPRRGVTARYRRPKVRVYPTSTF